MNLVTLSLHSTVVSKLIRNSRLVRIVAMHFETLPKFLGFYTITDLKHQAHVHTGRWRAEIKVLGLINQKQNNLIRKALKIKYKTNPTWSLIV